MIFLARVGDVAVFADGELRTIASIYDTSDDAQRTTTTATRLHCDHRWTRRARVTGVDEIACARCGLTSVVREAVKTLRR